MRTLVELMKKEKNTEQPLRACLVVTHVSNLHAVKVRMARGVHGVRHASSGVLQSA